MIDYEIVNPELNQGAAYTTSTALDDYDILSVTFLAKCIEPSRTYVETVDQKSTIFLDFLVIPPPRTELLWIRTVKTL